MMEPGRAGVAAPREVLALKAHIAELEEALDAIGSGGVDAVLVGAPGSQQVYTLTSAERPYRNIVEQMAEGACTVSERHVILFANRRFAELVGVEQSRIVGTRLSAYVHPREWQDVVALLSVLPGVSIRIEAQLTTPTGSVPVALAATCLDVEGILVRCLVATDLSLQKSDQASLERLVAERTSQLAAANTALASTNHTLLVVNKSEKAMMHATDEQTFIDQICRVIVDDGGYPLAWVGRAEEGTGHTVRPIGAAGDTGYLDGMSWTWGADELGAGPAGRAIRTGSRQVDLDIAGSPDFKPWATSAAAHGLRSVCALPLTLGSKVRGVLSIYSLQPAAFDDSSLTLLEGLAQDLSYGLSRLRDLARVRQSLDTTIGAVAAASELRDPYTAGHQRRVSQIAGALCHALGIDADQRTGIVMAATIHDIGKLVIPAEILSKPGRLTPQEMALVMSHPQAGFDIVSGIDFPWPVADMILQHHERIDGSGYPNGLAGDEILLGSRIIAVADVVEAMSSHRPYRPALGLDAALAEIETNSGILYDDTVVEACLFLCRQDTFAFDPSGSAPFGTFRTEAEEVPATSGGPLLDDR